MAYTDGKASPRVTPGVHRGTSPAPASAPCSTQELVKGQTTLFRTYSVAGSASVGNQIRTSPGKGLGVAGRPSAMATASKGRSLGASENPSK